METYDVYDIERMINAVKAAHKVEVDILKAQLLELERDFEREHDSSFAAFKFFSDHPDLALKYAKYVLEQRSVKEAKNALSGISENVDLTSVKGFEDLGL